MLPEEPRGEAASVHRMQSSENPGCQTSWSSTVASWTDAAHPTHVLEDMGIR